MRSYVFLTGTVTYAIKGRDLLRKNGIKAKIEKINSSKSSVGCGYAIEVEGNINAAENILRAAGIKILEINQR